VSPGGIGSIPGGITQETAGTSNPSNEVNANAEFIDVMRKIPRILCERYELLDVLGKGAHGRIYLATDLVTHDRVAIKLVSTYNFRHQEILTVEFVLDGKIQ
jgi:serine/threonine protein kinase